MATSLVRSVLNSLPGTAEQVEHELWLNGVQIGRAYVRRVLLALRENGVVGKTECVIDRSRGTVGVWHKTGVPVPADFMARKGEV